jgi:hypothetical protein
LDQLPAGIRERKWLAANRGKNAGFAWDQTSFAAFITNPRGKIPGNKVVFAGIRDETEIANLWATGPPAWNGRVLIDATNPFIEYSPKLVLADLVTQPSRH